MLPEKLLINFKEVVKTLKTAKCRGCAKTTEAGNFAIGGVVTGPSKINLSESIADLREEVEEITKPYHKIAREIADLVVQKQAAYGNSFGKAKEFIKILYPDGIPVERYGDMLTLVRIWDKIMRIATSKDALGESPYADILGYCLLALKEEGDYED